MYTLSERPRAGIRALRFLSLLLLGSVACLLLKESVSWSRMTGMILFLFLAGALLGRTRLRVWARLLAAGLGPFALRLVAFGIFRIVGAVFPGPSTDALFPAFDETFFPLLPLWWWTIVASDNAERNPRYTAVEAGCSLAFLAGLLWSQGGFRVSLFSHPSLLAAVAGAALFFSLAILAIGTPQRSRKGRGVVPRMGGFFLVLVLLMLWILGRYADDASAQGGGLLKPTLFRFDLSRYLKLEAEISLSDDLVLIVRKDPLDPNIYLRRFILSEYDPRGVFRLASRGRREPETLPGKAREWETPRWEGRSELDQEYWILTLDPGALLAVDAPVSVTPYRLPTGSSFSSAYSLRSYAATASLPLLLEGFDPDRTPPAFRLSEEERKTCTRWGDDPRIRALAEEARGEASTYYETVTAVLSYLRERYFYSLKPGVAADGNQLAHFLFESKKGYCSYFAFSMTILLRSLGVPARVAAGFFVDPDTAVLDFHPVRADMAHAWTEVWFGQYGWVAFDPTSRAIAPGERFEMSRGVDPGRLERLLREILQGVPEVSGTTGARGSGGRDFADAVRGAAAWVLRRLWLLLPILYAALVAAARGVRFLRILGVRQERRRVLLAWDALERNLAAAGIRRPRGESVPDFADRLDRDRPRGLGGGYGVYARAWENALFAPDVEASSVRKLVEDLSLSRAEVKRRTPLLRKLGSFLDLREALRPLPGGRKR